MTIKNIHINLMLLMLGFFSMQSAGFDHRSNSFFAIEAELEESNKEIDNVDFVEKSFHSASGDGGNAIIPTQNPPIKSPLVSETNLLRSESKELSQKPQLFILYCCLKLDC